MAEMPKEALVLAVASLVLVCSTVWLVGFSIPQPFPSRSQDVVGSHPIPSATCEKLECPAYEVVHEESDFQVRLCHAAKWAETSIINEISFKKAVYTGFRR